MIIAASGMAESGRILHHLAHGIGDHRNLVLSWAFRPSTRSVAASRSGQETVRILGEEYERRAEVESITGYSAHADRDRAPGLGSPAGRADSAGVRGPRRDRRRWRPWQRILRDEGVREVRVPSHGESFDL